MSGVLVLTASATAKPLKLSGIWQIGAPGTTTAMQCRAHLLQERPTRGNGFKGLLSLSRIDRVLTTNSQGVMERLSGGVLRRDLILSDSTAVSLSPTVSGDVVGHDTRAAKAVHAVRLKVRRLTRMGQETSSEALPVTSPPPHSRWGPTLEQSCHQRESPWRVM